MTLNEFQQQCVESASYPNQGSSSTLGMAMCASGMTGGLGLCAQGFKEVVTKAAMYYPTLQARQEMLGRTKQATTAGLRELLFWVACYAAEWNLKLEDVAAEKEIKENEWRLLNEPA